jgi:CubicO group peptidase (beta-lactamase class C family)
MGENASRRRSPVLHHAAVCLLLAGAVAAGGCGGEDNDGGDDGGPAAGPATTVGATEGTGDVGGSAATVPFTPRVAATPVTYPDQPAGVAWPTDGWETGPIPPGVDAAAVQARLDTAFGPESTGPAANYDAVVVVHAGRIVAERYRDGWGEATSIHRSWSMAKSVTATLVGILVGQGRLDVYAPAPVPAWSDPDDPRHAITTDQLLRMASGLVWNEAYLDTASDTVAMLSGAGKDDMAAYAADKPLEVPPDSRVRYATGTSNIVAGIVGGEVGHGDDYQAFIRSELLEPLGIADDEVAPGFDGAGNFVGGSVFDATARSFAKIGYLHLRGGVWDGRRILPEGWVDYVRTPTPAPAGSPEYGAHWWVDPEAPGRFRAGGLLGQHILVWPAEDLVVVVLSDRADGLDGDLRDDLADLFAAAAGP